MQYAVDTPVETLDEDRIGWTCEGYVSLISWDYVIDHRTIFREADYIEDLSPGDHIYLFESIHLPSIFSVAVLVVPGKYTN